MTCQVIVCYHKSSIREGGRNTYFFIWCECSNSHIDCFKSYMEMYHNTHIYAGTCIHMCFLFTLEVHIARLRWLTCHLYIEKYMFMITHPYVRLDCRTSWISDSFRNQSVSLLQIISSIFMLYFKDERTPMNSILFSWKSFLVSMKYFPWIIK